MSLLILSSHLRLCLSSEFFMFFWTLLRYFWCFAYLFTIYGEEFKLWGSLLCNFLHSAAFSYVDIIPTVSVLRHPFCFIPWT
jgi:hypothetical protein